LNDQEALYASAFSFYQQGHYASAEPLFHDLCQLNPFNIAFWKGLASCLQMQSKWKEALKIWGVSSLLDENDASNYFHLSECLYCLNEKEECLKTLIQAEKRLNQDEDLKTNIHLLKELLR
jgi:type III secretion system low calcium response chaperone LcrH/SycD